MCLAHSNFHLGFSDLESLCIPFWEPLNPSFVTEGIPYILPEEFSKTFTEGVPQALTKGPKPSLTRFPYTLSDGGTPQSSSVTEGVPQTFPGEVYTALQCLCRLDEGPITACKGFPRSPSCVWGSPCFWGLKWLAVTRKTGWGKGLPPQQVAPSAWGLAGGSRQLWPGRKPPAPSPAPPGTGRPRSTRNCVYFQMTFFKKNSLPRA